MRLGEASNPGPTFGCFNPTGIMGKGDVVSQLPQPATWAVQETHLTSMGISKFKSELKWNNCQLKVIHGAPAPPKTEGLNTLGGKHTGVCFLSSYPCRSIQHEWAQEEFETARVQTAAVLVEGHWVSMGTVYGYARSWSIEQQQDTNKLLEGLTSRIVEGSTGFRIISGDWNLTRDCISQAAYWESLGWREIQDIALSQWGWVQQATCKNTTVKDFMYVSPELVPLVRDVIVDRSYFPDHGVLIAKFKNFHTPKMIPKWRKPNAIDWNNVPKISEESVIRASEKADNNDQRYLQIFQTFEQAIDIELMKHSKPKLHESQKGRARTMEVSFQQEGATPIKPNRKGDIQTDVISSSLMFTRWTRQMRRIQHFLRCVLADNQTSTVMEHRINLWRKIRQATGFKPNFPAWWISHKKITHGAPAFLPEGPPDPKDTQAIFNEFLIEYQRFESLLKKERKDHAITRRERDHLAIFKDLKGELAEPVQTLVEEKIVQICEGGQLPEQGVWIKTDEDFEITDNVQCQIDGMVAHLQKLDERKYLCKNFRDFDKISKSSIQTSRLVGELEEMFQAFNQEWQSKWQRDHPDPEAWSAIVEFAKVALPKGNFQFPKITVELWKQTVKKKKHTSATGPDGISRADLLALPDSLTQNLLDIIQRIETGEDWPSQAMVGLVAALAKTPLAKQVQNFRPITILSMVYRVWSTIRTQQCLQIITSLAPTSMQGSLPQRSSKNVWYHLQGMIEFTFANNLQAAGAVIDIVKCFNCLPREPLLAIGIHIGLCSSVIRPWASALTSIQRRFTIRSAVGPPVMSCCGFPEGDPLSIIAMALANLVLDRWVAQKYPSIQTWTYVDNIETVCDTGQQAQESLGALEEFCDALDLQIDPKKTYCWTTSREERKELKEQDIQTLKAARDLGGHLNYSKWATKGTILDKIEKFAPFWKRLSRSSAPKFQKLRCLKVSAWPNMFHSISISSLGHVHFEKIRTKVMQSLGFNSYGANPKLQLSCICPSACDPEFWCAYETVMSWRKFTTPEMADFVMTHIADGGTMTPGPCSSISKVIHKLGWAWVQTGIVLDENRQPLDLRNCPIQELFVRVKSAWQTIVFGETEILRKTMKGLSDACVATTTRDLDTWNPDEQGVLRCALNGTLYTHDALVHTGKVEDFSCKYCGEKDSIKHRHWECPHFADLTNKCLSKIECDISQLPNSLVLHGWIPKNKFVVKLKSLLCGLPNLAHTHFVPDDFHPKSCVEVFTDGSCIRPTRPDQRIATWGMVVWHNNKFHTVAEGGVPGFHQTSLRAEIFAAVAALSFAVQQQVQIRIWIDNQTVCDFLTRLISGNNSTVNPQRKDADLWQWLSRQFEDAKPFVKQVVKVRSHVGQSAIDEFEEWVFAGNDKADEAAQQARKNLSQEIWWVWEQVVATDAFNDNLRQAIHTLFVSVGMRAVQSQPKTKLPEPCGTQQNETTIDIDTNMVALSNLAIEDVPQHFLTDETEFLLTWLKTIVTGEAPIRWVTWHQLLIDYQFSSGRAGPRNVGRRWRNVGYKQSDYSFSAHAKWFSHYFQNLGTAVSMKPKVQTMRPPSHVLTYWGGSVKVRISSTRLDRVDTFLKEWATRVPARNLSRDLSDVPQAKP